MGLELAGKGEKLRKNEIAAPNKGAAVF